MKKTPNKKLKPLFPYFGGKSMIAPTIWKHLGDVESYIEPFFGSGAVLAARPEPTTSTKRLEMVGDLNGWLVNAWRSVALNPEEVMRQLQILSFSEGDLRAAKKYVYSHDVSEELQADIEYYDARLAAYWLAIMGGFVGNGGADNNLAGCLQTGTQGTGVHRPAFSIDDLHGWQARLARVRMLAAPWERTVSSWSRVGGYAVKPPIGIYLDPPYADGSDNTYGEKHDASVALASAKWAIEHGDDPRYRIIYSGYEGTVEFPENWKVIEWKSHGGLGNRGDSQGRANKTRERLWLSPHCLNIE